MFFVIYSNRQRGLYAPIMQSFYMVYIVKFYSMIIKVN